MAKPLVVWFFTDNKPGHKNQLEGLLLALSEIKPISAHWVESPRWWQWWLRSLLRKNFFSSFYPDLPAPDMVIAAGSSTQLSSLFASKIYQASSVVLMKPSWPLPLFDAAIVPQHDHVSESNNVFITQGVLNKVRFNKSAIRTKKIILLGGPSKHYHWNVAVLVESIVRLFELRGHDFVLASSRRTPIETVIQLKDRFPELAVIQPDEVDNQWLAQQLQISAEVWVSEDSVSMLYEALSSGAKVGVLSVPCIKENRVSNGVRLLMDAKKVMQLSCDDIDSLPVLQEADKAAQWLLKQGVLGDQNPAQEKRQEQSR